MPTYPLCTVIKSSSKMADVSEMRIFSADQITVPEDLPQILKEFSKEVIRNNPTDLVQFSKEYFEKKHNENMAAAQAAAEQK